MGVLRNKHYLQERLSIQLLGENINRIKIFALIPAVGFLLFQILSTLNPLLVSPYPIWFSLSLVLSMSALSFVAFFARKYMSETGQTIVLNTAHFAILSFSVSAFFCREYLQEYSLTIYAVGIFFCSAMIVRRPFVMIGGYVLLMAVLFGYAMLIGEIIPPLHVFFILLIAVVACMSAVVRFSRSLSMYLEQEQIRALNHQLELISATDKLTGLANRMKTDEEFHKLMILARENRTPLSIVLFDIDNFKTINDTYGHQTGDLVMQTIAGVIRQNTRQNDFVGRWGGDEFLVICPQMNLHLCVLLAERVRAEVNATALPHGIKATLSGGVGQITSEETESCLFSRVDEALYSAKVGGRNRLEISLDGGVVLQN